MSRPKKKIPPLDSVSYGMAKYYQRRVKKEEQAKKRKEEVKREFEEFLNEESAKYPLGYNPYQE